VILPILELLHLDECHSAELSFLQKLPVLSALKLSFHPAAEVDADSRHVDAAAARTANSTRIAWLLQL
jgi:hypothetical protein